ncbi:MAG: hypothetical protein OXT07_12600, partial [bacterium]|nr:hypothetical protein [bacterium]
MSVIGLAGVCMGDREWLGRRLWPGWMAGVAVLALVAALLVAVPAVPAGAQQVVPISFHPYNDKDDDDDGLIEVSSLKQLNAIRWDLNGDGAVDYYLGPDDGYRSRLGRGYTPWTAYRIAFPDALAGMGCPSSGCIGYELVADLDFDTNGNGQADSGDAWWNGGKGWVPLFGAKAIDSSEKYLRFVDADEQQRRLGDRPDRRVRMFTGVFEGNGRTIANLHVHNPDQFYVGLFGYIGPGAHVRNLGLTAPNSDSRVHGNNEVGALAGILEGGRVSGVWSDVDVSAGYSTAGGLVGAIWRQGVIVESYATGNVSGPAYVGGLVGMLNLAGAAAVYATGRVTASRSHAGGLVGDRAGGYMRAAYATGDVTVTDGRTIRYRDGNGDLRFWSYAIAGGLAGLYRDGNSLETRANYSTGAVTVPDGHGGSGGLIGACRPHSGDEPEASYWDAEASGVSSGECAAGHTTAQLQA